MAGPSGRWANALTILPLRKLGARSSKLARRLTDSPTNKSLVRIVEAQKRVSKYARMPLQRSREQRAGVNGRADVCGNTRERHICGRECAVAKLNYSMAPPRAQCRHSSRGCGLRVERGAFRRIAAQAAVGMKREDKLRLYLPYGRRFSPQLARRQGKSRASQPPISRSVPGIHAKQSRR